MSVLLHDEADTGALCNISLLPCAADTVFEDAGKYQSLSYYVKELK